MSDSDFIELPDFVPPAAKAAHVRRDRTAIPDVYRRYDLTKADRIEPAAVIAPSVLVVADAKSEDGS